MIEHTPQLRRGEHHPQFVECLQEDMPLQARTNAVEFIEITTAGNAKDFGDMVTARGMPSTVSNGHGGLSG